MKSPDKPTKTTTITIFPQNCMYCQYMWYEWLPSWNPSGHFGIPAVMYIHFRYQVSFDQMYMHGLQKCMFRHQYRLLTITRS